MSVVIEVAVMVEVAVVVVVVEVVVMAVMKEGQSWQPYAW